MTAAIPETSLLVSGTTRLYGIMGYPISHSLSPLMHTYAFRHHKLDCVYMPFPVPPAQLCQAVAGVTALGIGGFNVTIPHKETIMPYLDEVTPEAQAIGAVNTVYLREGRWVGHNTDGEGFLQPLQALQIPLAEMASLILGAGGAARAIAMALLQRGCTRLTIANRTYARAERLIGDLQAYFPQVSLHPVPFERAAQEASQHRLIVNATAIGLHDPGEELFPAECFCSEHVAYDIVYRPLYTPFLQTAQRCGATIITGIDMLIGQGAAAFQLWTGQRFPTAEVRHILQPFLTIA